MNPSVCKEMVLTGPTNIVFTVVSKLLTQLRSIKVGSQMSNISGPAHLHLNSWPPRPHIQRTMKQINLTSEFIDSWIYWQLHPASCLSCRHSSDPQIHYFFYIPHAVCQQIRLTPLSKIYPAADHFPLLTLPSFWFGPPSLTWSAVGTSPSRVGSQHCSQNL